MRFAFDEQQTMLRDMLRVALEREAPLERLRAWSASGDFTAFDACVHANGWAGIGTGDECGGQGGGVLEQAMLFEALGQHGAPSGGLLAQAAALALAAAAEVDAAEIAALIEGRVGAVVDAGRALDSGGGAGLQEAQGRLSGKLGPALVAGTSASPRGPLFVVPEGDGLALWRVAHGAAGLQCTARPMLDRTRRFADFTLQQVAARRIGGLTASAVERVNARLALLLAAESLGLARRMLALTVEYARQRVQFGVPIGSFQAVKHEAAQALVDIEAAHSGVYYAAWALDQGEPDALLHGWIAKAFTCEVAARTADRALALHGAIGYTLEYELHFFFKRAKLNLELLGSPRHYRERIASALPLVA